MFELIIKIALVHLLGDFVFQTNKMVENIGRQKYKSKYLYLHVLIHFLLIVIITKFDKNYILPAFLLAASHLIIDILTKIVIKNKISSIRNLLLDQALHAIAIALFIKHFYDYNIDFDIIFNPKNYLFISAVVSITYVSAILIKKMLEVFNYPLPNGGFRDAGKYIGMLERLFIFGFVITSFWEGIGFLLGAKSIFRFGDLTENKEIKLTEYILIGTLISFGVAILIGEIYLKLETLL